MQICEKYKIKTVGQIDGGGFKFHKDLDCGKKQKKRSYEGRQENGCDRDLFENNKQKREIQRRGESIGVKSKCNRRGTK